MTDSSSQRPEDIARWAMQVAEKALAEIREQSNGASENDLHEAIGMLLEEKRTQGRASDLKTWVRHAAIQLLAGLRAAAHPRDEERSHGHRLLESAWKELSANHLDEASAAANGTLESHA